MQRPVSTARLAALAAAVLFAGAVAAFGAAFPAFSHLAHPVALLGASGMPRAAGFNALAFVVPGLLVAGVAQARRSDVANAHHAARLGPHALALSGLAFAAQGLLPLDSHDLLAASSRLHAAAWTFWWVAFAAGAALLAWGLRGTSRARVGIAVFAAAIVALGFALVVPGLLPVGLSQRIAFAAWFAGAIALAPVSRSAASSRGSSPTGPA